MVPASGARDSTASNADLCTSLPCWNPMVACRETVLPCVRDAQFAAVLAFVAEGRTLTMGAFRLHVTRLAKFLKSLTAASDNAPSDKEARLIEKALDAASTGIGPAGKWLVLARKPGTGWKQIAEALK